MCLYGRDFRYSRHDPPRDATEAEPSRSTCRAPFDFLFARLSSARLGSASISSGLNSDIWFMAAIRGGYIDTLRRVTEISEMYSAGMGE